MDDKDPATALRAAFAEAIAADEVDVLTEDGSGAVEVAGEEWTLRLEGWPDRPLAWLALDDEPDAVAERRAAREAAIGDAFEAALLAADDALAGALAAALRASADPLSLDLAAALAARRST